MGIKDNKRVSGAELLKRRIALSIALNDTMGRSSTLYNRLYEEGLINDSFRFEASLDQAFGFVAWGGQSVDPKKTAEIISGVLKELAEKGIDEKSFTRIKKSYQGMYIRSFNSVDTIAREVMDTCFNGTSYFDVGKIYEELDVSYTNNVIREVFNNKAALSVINPL